MQTFKKKKKELNVRFDHNVNYTEQMTQQLISGVSSVETW